MSSLVNNAPFRRAVSFNAQQKPPPGFSLASAPSLSFDSSVPRKEQERLTEKWNRVMRDAEQESAIELGIAEAYDRIDDYAVSKIARELIGPLVPFNRSWCKTCDVSCIFKYTTALVESGGEQHGSIDNSSEDCEKEALEFAKTYIKAALKRRKFGPDSPTAAVSKYIEAVVINFYRRHENDLGVYCPNESCRDKRDIVFKPLSSLLAPATEETAKLLETLKTAMAEPTNNDISSSSSVAAPLRLVDEYVDLLGNVIEKESQVPYTPLSDAAAKALPFSRCHYVEIMQAPFVVMFVRYTGNEDFVTACIGCVKSGSVPNNVRMMYQCDLSKTRLLSYGQVLKQTQFYLDNNFEAQNIHQFVHPIQAAFNKKFILESNRSILQIMQATRRHWAAQLDASQRQVIDAEYRQQKEKHQTEKSQEKQRAESIAPVGGGLQEYRRRQQQRRKTLAPTVVAAHQSKLQNDRATKLIREFREAIHSLSNWLWGGASDNVRCESICLNNNMVFPFGTIVPFVLFVVGYFNLIERHVDAEKVRQSYFDPLKALFESGWDAELQTLYSISSPQHVVEQGISQKNMIGFIASERPLTLLVSKDALYTIDVFLSLQGDNTCLLRAMLSGTFLTLRPRPPVGHVSPHGDRTARKRNNSDVNAEIISVNDCIEDVDHQKRTKKRRRS